MAFSAAHLDRADTRPTGWPKNWHILYASKLRQIWTNFHTFFHRQNQEKIFEHYYH